MNFICETTVQFDGRFIRKQATGKWKCVVNSEPIDDKAKLRFYSRSEPEFKGHLAIEILSAKGKRGCQLVPNNGVIRDRQDLFTDRDRYDRHWDMRMWRPIWVGNGFHFQLYNTSLYLGISDDLPILSATPVVWTIQEDERKRLVRARADKLWQEGRRDDVIFHGEAERSCFE